MTYTIRIDPRALRELQKVKGKAARDALTRAIGNLAVEPYRNAERLTLPKKSALKSLLRKRVGNFRIVYTVHDGNLLVLVVAVGDRKDIYQRLARARLL